jgi:hypothetical protein
MFSLFMCMDKESSPRTAAAWAPKPVSLGMAQGLRNQAIMNCAVISFDITPEWVALVRSIFRVARLSG